MRKSAQVCVCYLACKVRTLAKIPSGKGGFVLSLSEPLKPEASQLLCPCLLTRGAIP